MVIYFISSVSLLTLKLEKCSLFIAYHLIQGIKRKSMSVIPPEQTLGYINEARTQPKKFAEYVKKELSTFFSQTQMPLYPGCNYSTNEGQGAWKQAITFLTSQNPLPAYILNQGLTLAAEDHAVDMAKTGIFGHNSSNGASFTDRIAKRCGQSYGAAGQNIGSEFKVQQRNHALQTVMGLIIDDGVSSRGHRKNIFSKDFKYVGISSRVQKDKIITVMDFHSENLQTINGSQNSSNAGNNLQYEKKGNNNQFSQGNFGFGSGGSNKNQFQQFEFGNNDGWGSNDGWGDNGNNGWPQGGQLSTQGQGQRRVISTSTSTKSQTCNGVTKILKITKKKYSDGTQQEEREETTKS